MSDQGGRPTDYKPEYCQKLIEHMSQGKSLETFGVQFGVCRRTVYQWIKDHPEFSHAKDQGVDASLAFWENHGVDGLYATTETVKEKDNYKTTSKSMNAAVWVANMRKRFHEYNDDLFKPKNPAPDFEDNAQEKTHPRLVIEMIKDE